jgi:hypothetical protein
VASTSLRQFDVSHPGIVAIVLSLSKPYGLFRFRIGATFSRSEVPSLYGNKWFKDVVRHLQGLHVVERLGMDSLHRKYSLLQRQIIDEINSRHDLGLRQSDVLLLATLPVEETAGWSRAKLAEIAPFRRGSCYRFCLTPYFEEREKALL